MPLVAPEKTTPGITEIAADETHRDSAHLCGCEIPRDDRDGFRAAIAAECAAHAAEQRALDQLQAGSAEWIPDALIFPDAREPCQARGERRMRGRGHIREAMRVARVGRKSRAQLD